MLFLFASFVLFSAFLVYLLNEEDKRKRSLLKELLLAASSSLFFGFGAIFFTMFTGNFL